MNDDALLRSTDVLYFTNLEITLYHSNLTKYEIFSIGR